MLYIQQFQHNRLDYLRQYQRLQIKANPNFLLCGTQYIEKFPKLSRPVTSTIGYPRNQALFFLSRIPSLEMKSTNENQQQTEITQENKESITISPKSSIRPDDKQISNENNEKFPPHWQHQVTNNVYRLAKFTTKGNQLSTSVSPPVPTLTEPYRPKTAPLIREENNRRAISVKLKYTTPSRSPTLSRTPHSIDSSNNVDTITNSLFVQLKSTTLKSDNHSVHQPCIDTHIHINNTSNTNNQNNSLDLSVGTNRSTETTLNDKNESKILRHNNQCKKNGFQHIANLGSWQRNSKQRIESSERSKEIEHEEESPKDLNQSTMNSSKIIYDYKNPFSEEYDQAISLQTQFQTNEWNLKDFYRDVKTQFESGTNTKPVFEKCLKLARLQANTIKWEQRRRQNLNIYNRLLRNSSLDNNILNTNGNISSRNNNEKDIRDINELRRELRCHECKRLACLGNCAPGQEYHQYKRYIPFSSLTNTREQIRCKLNFRTQRSTMDIRPRSTQQITRETKFIFEDEVQTKRPQKKLTNEFPPGKSFRSQQRETLTVIPTHKILS